MFHGAGSGLKKNQRKHPGIKGRRPDLKGLHRREAAERLAAYQALPLSEKIKRNPKKFAEGALQTALAMEGKTLEV